MNLGDLALFENGRASQASDVKLQDRGQNTYHHQGQLYGLEIHHVVPGGTRCLDPLEQNISPAIMLCAQGAHSQSHQ